jgi:DNA-binding MarR family transcriptional regulator
MKDYSRQPIGYWLKQGHDALDNHMNGVLDQQNLTRNHWQVLNLVAQADEPVTPAQLSERMKIFVDAARLGAILDDFVNKGWIQPSGNGFSITEAGKAQHAQLSTLIDSIRTRAIQGISTEEYATVIQVLEKLVNNLT